VGAAAPLGFEAAGLADGAGDLRPPVALISTVPPRPEKTAAARAELPKVPEGRAFAVDLRVGAAISFQRLRAFSPGGIMEEIWKRAKRLDLSEVFVVGGQPEHTYVARDSQNIEKEFNSYVADGHKFLSLTGSTKTGKSVLLNRLLGNGAIIVNGGAIRSEDDFFESVRLSLSSSGSSAHQAHLQGASKFVLLDALQKSSRKLVIEDFHFIAPANRKAIAHVLKEPVRVGLRVVLVSVPHRGFDAVRAENELNQRVQVLSIPSWTVAELEQIALKGFSALNVFLDASIVTLMAENCHGSPQLMQALCKQLCRDNEILQTVQGNARELRLPDRRALFAKVAAAELSPANLEVLLQARGLKAKRTYYRAKDGNDYDVYSLTLKAIAELLPAPKLRSESIWAKAQASIRRPNALYANQVTSALNRMSEAAKQLPGERVLEWDEVTHTVHIVDPGLAFLIKWGDWSKG
jgi:hypothetical protein